MYVWLEAFHIISVICWFAALFYLPRLFVYHAMAEDEIGKERFKVMERKLYRGIATPAMIATIILGGAMAARSWDYFSSAGWFHAKITLVVLLIIYHHLCLYFMKQFRADTNTRSHVFYRWFNEIPVIMLVGIVILVVVKPF
ncbi:MAG: protoporphyrinogen oxidase HemJ [Porticoccaceae bacterium]|nr:protoporphyrinogen oxidase HemJ [Porticoccaceae bacterium]